MSGHRKGRHKEHGAGELNLVPYMDIVVNLILFLMLSSTGLTQFGVINVSAPTIGGGEAAEEKTDVPLNLTVAIIEKGFYVSGTGGNLAAAGNSTSEPTIAKTGGDYDYAALKKQMVELKSLFPKETKLIITGNSDIAYDVIIKVMDATRNDGPNILFPDVTMSPGFV